MDKQSVLTSVKDWRWWLSWVWILAGCCIMAAGFVYFINPYNIVPGGVYGASIVLHNIFPAIQVGYFGYMFDIPLLIIAMSVFGGKFGFRTFLAALTTPTVMNFLEKISYPDEAALQALDPSRLLGGMLDMSNHLMLSCIMGAVLIGIGQGIVVRNQATTGGTDIIGMLLQKYCRIKFSTGILIADGVVVLSGLLVIGFGVGSADRSESTGWLLSLYSLISIFVSSRVVAFVLSGTSYDKLLFIISDDKDKELRRFIIEELDRSATYIKASGMYTGEEREMIFLVISRNEVPSVQQKIKEIDPRAFLVVTDAYDTFGEGFKPFPEKDEIKAE